MGNSGPTWQQEQEVSGQPPQWQVPGQEESTRCHSAPPPPPLAHCAGHLACPPCCGALCRWQCKGRCVSARPLGPRAGALDSAHCDLLIGICSLARRHRCVTHTLCPGASSQAPGSPRCLLLLLLLPALPKLPTTRADLDVSPSRREDQAP